MTAHGPCPEGASGARRLFVRRKNNINLIFSLVSGDNYFPADLPDRAAARETHGAHPRELNWTLCCNLIDYSERLH